MDVIGLTTTVAYAWAISSAMMFVGSIGFGLMVGGKFRTKNQTGMEALIELAFLCLGWPIMLILGALRWLTTTPN